ncbi:16S rRNA processing protein RimM [bacterium]|nr:16S rRNA processing protein RimM [bacterium]
MEKFVSIGKILNFHGIKGEAKVGFQKGSEDQMLSLKKVYVRVFDDKALKFKVKSSRIHKNFAIMKFEGINSIDELLEYKGEKIYIEKSEALEALSEDEFMTSDLIGLNVFDNNDDYIGKVVDIGTNNANDILCIKPENPDYEQFLIPFVQELVPVVDISRNKIVIKPIEGLLE